MRANLTDITAEWHDRLLALENKYGGVQTAPARNVSPHSDRLQPGYRMRGGDRMRINGYAEAYSKILPHVFPKVIVELGVFCGSGLAMWCELFPFARVIGLDIDLGFFGKHKSSLRRLGAFQFSTPEVYQFDELAPDAPERLAKLLGGDKIELAIDDALHHDAAVLGAFRLMRPHLAGQFTYFAEDNTTVFSRLRAENPQYRWRSYGGLSVARP